MRKSLLCYPNGPKSLNLTSLHLYPGGVLWIEPYPADGAPRGQGGNYDWVTFRWVRQSKGRLVAADPVWHRVNREWVEGLLRLKLPDISSYFAD
jgi:hypothetical protein